MNMTQSRKSQMASSHGRHKKVPAVAISSLLAKRAYRKYTGSLEPEDVPWMPLLASNSYLKMAARSRLHRHPGHIEVIYCRRGVFEYESCGQVYRLAPGQVFVSRPNEPHRMLDDPTGQANYSFLFKLGGRTGWRGADADLRFVEERLRTMPRLFEGGQGVALKFAQLIRLVEQDGPGGAERRLRIRHAAVALLLSVVDAAEAPRAGGTSGRVAALAEEIRNHPETARSIEEMAQCVGASPSSLTSAFKAAVGYTPHAYLLKCRIDRAKDLLKKGASGVSEVALSLGFPSSQHFATQFRKLTGQSPRDWLRGVCS